MTRDDHALLRFEEAHPRPGALKEELVRRSLGLTPVRYQMRLLRLVRTPEVVAAFPVVARRVVEQRERASASRSARSF